MRASWIAGLIVIGSVSPCVALIPPDIPRHLHQQGGGKGKPQTGPSTETPPPAPASPANRGPHQAPDQADSGNKQKTGWLATFSATLWEARPTDAWQALFNALLVGVGVLQWRVYNRQAEIMRDTREIAFASLGRPHIFVEMASHNLGKWREGREILSFKFRVVNYGNSPAVVTSTLAYAFLSRGPRRSNPRDTEETEAILDFPAACDLLTFISYNPLIYRVTEVPLPPLGGAPLIARDGIPIVERVSYINGPEVQRWRHFVVAPGKDTGLFASDISADPLGRPVDPDFTEQNKYLFNVTSPDEGVHPWLLGQVVYYDTLGRRYHTNFCGYGSREGEVIEFEEAPYNERT